MAVEVIVDNQWATIKYEQDRNFIYHTFHQPIGGDVFRETMEAGLETLKKNFVGKWLSDDRKNGKFSPEDIDYALNDWGPRAAQAGWKYWALVVPESVAGRAGMTQIVEAFATMGVRVAIFTEVDEAREWLLEQ